MILLLENLHTYVASRQQFRLIFLILPKFNIFLMADHDIFYMTFVY